MSALFVGRVYEQKYHYQAICSMLYLYHMTTKKLSKQCIKATAKETIIRILQIFIEKSYLEIHI